MGHALGGFFAPGRYQYASAVASQVGIRPEKFFRGLEKAGASGLVKGGPAARGYMGLAAQVGLAKTGREAQRLAATEAGRAQIREAARAQHAAGQTPGLMAASYGPTGGQMMQAEAKGRLGQAGTHLRRVGSAGLVVASSLMNVAMMGMMLYTGFKMLKSSVMETSDELHKGMKQFQDDIDRGSKVGTGAIKPFVRWLGLGKEVTEEERFQMRRTGAGRIMNIMEAETLRQKEAGEDYDPFKALKVAMDTQEAALKSIGFFKGEDEKEAWAKQRAQMSEALHKELYSGLIGAGKIVPAHLKPFAKIMREKYTAALFDPNEFFPTHPVGKGVGSRYIPGMKAPLGTNPFTARGLTKPGSKTKQAWEHAQDVGIHGPMDWFFSKIGFNLESWDHLMMYMATPPDVLEQMDYGATDIFNPFGATAYDLKNKLAAHRTSPGASLTGPDQDTMATTVQNELAKIKDATKQGVIEGLKSASGGKGMKVHGIAPDINIIYDHTQGR